MTALAEATSAQVTRPFPVERIDPLTDTGWDTFVENHSAGTAFQTSSWARVLIDTYGYEPHFHVIRNGRGEIEAAWPAMLIRSRLTRTRLVSMPFSDFAPPLVDTFEQGERLANALIDTAGELGAKRLEVRGWPSSLRPVKSLSEVQGYVRHIIDLTVGVDAAYSRLSENARRSLKKAEKYGVTTRVGADKQDLDIFITLNLRLRRKHGMLPQPNRFFSAIHRHVIEPGHGYLLFAEREGTPLAALMCLRHGGVTLDKFAVNDQSLSEFRGSHAAMWKAIEIEIARGARAYDMGRSDAGATGLHRFKAQWGGVMVPAPYYYHPSPGGLSTEDPKGAKKRILDAFSRFAPDPVFSAAGTLIYRHLG